MVFTLVDNISAILQSEIAEVIQYAVQICHKTSQYIIGSRQYLYFYEAQLAFQKYSAVMIPDTNWKLEISLDFQSE